MIIIGCDYRPGFQQIAFVDTSTGEVKELRLEHREPAEKFYQTIVGFFLPIFLRFRMTPFSHFFCWPDDFRFAREPLGVGVNCSVHTGSLR